MPRKGENSLSEIIHKIGFPLMWRDIVSTCKVNVDRESVEKFSKEMQNLTSNDFESYAKVFENNSDIFDTDLFLFRVTKLLDEEQKRDNEMLSFIKTKPTLSLTEFNKKRLELVGTNPKNNKSKQDRINLAKKMLQKVDTLDVNLNEDTYDITIDSSKEYLGNKNYFKRRREESLDKLAKIENSLGLENVIAYLRPTDLIDICRYPNLGNTLAVKLLRNKKYDNKNLKVQDRAKKTEAVLEKEILASERVFDWDEFEQTIKDYAEYIDLDKMLILANTNFYAKYGNEYKNFSEEEAEELSEFTKKVEALLDNKKTKVKSQRYPDSIDIENVKESVKFLDKHFIYGQYQEEIEINGIVEDTISGRTALNGFSEKDLERLAFTVTELTFIVKNNPSALKEVIERKLVTKDELDKIIGHQTSFTFDQIQYLYGLNYISKEQILEYYMDGKIESQTVKELEDSLDEEKKEEFSSAILSTEKLVELLNNPETQEEFDRYRKLYKLLKIDGKTLDERKKVAEEILENSNDLLEDEKLHDLYHMGLIPVDTLIDFVGPQAVSNLYMSGELKVLDSRRMYEDGIITKEAIIDILKNPDIDDTEKIVLIYSTFSENKYAQLRDEFMEYIDETTNGYNSHRTSKNEESEQSNSKDDTISFIKKKKYVTDPCSRWNLMAALDEDYSQEFISDGHVIFYLPNREKYIIEKLYDPSKKTAEKRKPAHGAATYILDEKTFNMYRNEIIVENQSSKGKSIKKIDRKTLIELNNLSLTKKIVHKGWSNGLCKYFDIDNPSLYTEKRRQKIKKYAEEVEKSKKELDR